MPTGKRPVRFDSDKAEAWTYGSGYAAKQLTKTLDRMEHDVLPRLRANYTRLAEELATRGVSVEEHGRMD
jgi:hypothetical protein